MNTENNKRVRIDESGILTIINDNATWVNGDTTTDIKGDYAIGEHDLKRLMVMMSGQDMMVKEVDTWWYTDDYARTKITNNLITTNKEIAEEIEEMHTTYNKKIKSEHKATRDYEELRRKVEEFNKSRRWWERKLKL